MGGVVISCEFFRQNKSNVEIGYKALSRTNCIDLFSNVNRPNQLKEILMNNVDFGYQHWELRGVKDHLYFYQDICEKCYIRFKKEIHLPDPERLIPILP